LVILGKILGSGGVLLSLYGFLLLSWQMLYVEGLGGIEAKSALSRTKSPWWARLIVKILMFVGGSISPHPYEQSDLEVRDKNRRSREIKICRGGICIILGSLFQALAYWFPSFQR